MAPEKQKDAPLGVLLITTFWIMLGTSFFSMMSLSSRYSYNTVPSLIFMLLGIFFILLGWSFLTFKKWAYYVSFILSILGSIGSIYSIPAILMVMYYSSSMTIFYVLFIAFIPMAFYLFKNANLFVEECKTTASDMQKRICPICEREIPFDARFCPYCEKEFEALKIEREQTKKEPPEIKYSEDG